jgi:hypothetical protein
VLLTPQKREGLKFNDWTMSRERKIELHTATINCSLECFDGLVGLSVREQLCLITLIQTEEPSDAKSQRSFLGSQQNCV